MFAVTPSPLSFRAVSITDTLNPGEVAVDIPTGATTDNSVWDATLSGGSGGVRLMTPVELAAAQSALSAQQVAATQTVTALQNLLHVMTSTTPFTALSPAQQTNYNVAVGRCVLVLLKASVS